MHWLVIILDVKIRAYYDLLDPLVLDPYLHFSIRGTIRTLAAIEIQNQEFILRGVPIALESQVGPVRTVEHIKVIF